MRSAVVPGLPGALVRDVDPITARRPAAAAVPLRHDGERKKGQEALPRRALMQPPVPEWRHRQPRTPPKRGAVVWL
jgi:hypothetical protein